MTDVAEIKGHRSVDKMFCLVRDELNKVFGIWYQWDRIGTANLGSRYAFFQESVMLVFAMFLG